MGNIITAIKNVLPKVTKPTKVLLIIGACIMAFGGIIGGAILCWANPDSGTYMASSYFRHAAGWAVMFSLPFFLLGFGELIINLTSIKSYHEEKSE